MTMLPCGRHRPHRDWHRGGGPRWPVGWLHTKSTG